MKIIDAHTHIRNIDQQYSPLYETAQQLGYSKLTVLSMQCAGDLLQNLICASAKLLHPHKTYAFGGLDYATGRDFASQARNLRNIGFDGIKMLEGKPTIRKKLNRALNDPVYDEYYSFLEQTGFPLLLHVADPCEFWDKDKVPSWAVEHGWFYDETHVPYKQYYDEVEDMLAKHPKLRAIIAHFFFLSSNPEAAQKFLDDHPSVFIDITAGIEMYEDFTKDPAFWHGFFVKNKNRIIFGTDSADNPKKEDPEDPKADSVDINSYAAMEIEFLRTNKTIKVYDKQITGIGLPQDVQELIFAHNYELLVTDSPAPINMDLLMQETELMKKHISSDKEMDCFNKVMEMLN